MPRKNSSLLAVLFSQIMSLFFALSLVGFKQGSLTWRAVANVLLSSCNVSLHNQSGLKFLSTNPSNENYVEFGVAEVFKSQERRVI